jgi:DNA-binding transcriptional ArsR family regulator
MKRTTRTKRSSPGRLMTGEEITAVRRKLQETPGLEKTCELFNLVGSATRLKLLYLLESETDLPVGDLAERVGVSMSSVSQHLAKLRMYGLVAARREAQSLYYRLTDHPFNETLRAAVF